MNNYILLFFDILLVLTLLCVAYQILSSEDIFKGVVLFIAFSLLMALAWIRMAAPDVALAEAALGAGLSGPLFLSALRRLRQSRKGERRINIDQPRASQKP